MGLSSIGSSVLKAPRSRKEVFRLLGDEKAIKEHFGTYRAFIDIQETGESIERLVIEAQKSRQVLSNVKDIPPWLTTLIDKEFQKTVNKAKARMNFLGFTRGAERVLPGIFGATTSAILTKRVKKPSRGGRVIDAEFKALPP